MFELQVDKKGYNEGVSSRFFQHYDMEAEFRNSNAPNPKHEYLCTKVTHIGTDKYMVKNIEGAWEPINSENRAITNVWQYWGGQQSHNNQQFVIEKKDVRNFVKDYMRSVSNKIQMPFDSTFIKDENKKILLNEWFNAVRKPDESKFIHAEPLLKMARECLCNEEPADYSIEDYVNEILKEKTDFAYMMHWLANVRQNLGTNSNTALVIHGAAQGIGKNTLFKYFSATIGRNVCKFIKKDDLKRGWTDGIVGKFFVHADEWNKDDIADQWSNLKGWVGNDESAATKRNVGEFEFVNASSWVFTTNDEDPFPSTIGDRRWTFLHTTTDEDYGRKIASPIAAIFKDNIKIKGFPSREEMIDGLNAVLCMISVKHTWITYPLNNAAMEQIREYNKTRIEQFLESDRLRKFALTTDEITGLEMFNQYEKWAMDVGIEEQWRVQNVSSLGKRLANYPSIITSKRKSTGMIYYLKNIDK